MLAQLKFGLVLGIGLGLSACHPAQRALSTALARPSSPTWHTLTAQQTVTVESRASASARDQPEHRSFRALIAVEQPDRFRLRAFGPGGITLFDLVSVGDQARIVSALRDPANPTFAEIVQSVAADLRAAYELHPAPPERVVHTQGDTRLISEPGRSVRLEDYRLFLGHAVFTRVSIDNLALHYHVTVETSTLNLDRALAPQLFAPVVTYAPHAP